MAGLAVIVRYCVRSFVSYHILPSGLSASRHRATGSGSQPDHPSERVTAISRARSGPMVQGPSLSPPGVCDTRRRAHVIRIMSSHGSSDPLDCVISTWCLPQASRMLSVPGNRDLPNRDVAGRPGRNSTLLFSQSLVPYLTFRPVGVPPPTTWLRLTAGPLVGACHGQTPAPVVYVSGCSHPLSEAQ